MMSGFWNAVGGGWGWGMGLGWIIPVVVIGLIEWALAALARSHGDDGGGAGVAVDRSRAILDARYADGELDLETYRRMRRELERAEWRR